MPENNGRRREDPHDEDGCDVDMKTDPVSDDELIVVFGDDVRKFAEYKRLFREGA
jgi:hypothetical protein